MRYRLYGQLYIKHKKGDIKMEKLENLAFDYNEKEYEIGFDLETVKEYANYSISKRGQLKDVDFFKFALKKYSNAGFLTDKVVEEIVGGLAENGLGDMSYEELIQYSINLYIQAIDTASESVEAAEIKINEDNSVIVKLNGEDYKLMFTRESLENAVMNDQFDFNNMLELYVAGSTLVKVALQHYKKRFSVKLHDEIFMALWATKNVEGSEDDLSEMMNALTFHMNEVIQSGVKKSKAVITLKKR